MNDDEVRALVADRQTTRRSQRSRRSARRELLVPVPPGVLEHAQAILDEHRVADPVLPLLRERADLEALMQPDIPALATTRRRRR